MEVLKNTEWSEENCADLVQKLRKDILKDFLDERYLREYMATRYNVRDISNVKVEFVKRSIREAINAPLDLVHYESTLTLLRDNQSLDQEEVDEKLVYQEVGKILMQYIF